MMAGMFGTVILLMYVLGGHTLDLLRATVTSGNPPSTPRVRCWCASYPNRTLCSWPEPSHEPPTHYFATYSERHGEPITKQCHLIPPSSSSSVSSSSSEQVWHCQMSNLKLLTNYIINITAVSSGGSSSYLASFMLEDIVKPDPPVDVQVSTRNIKNVVMEWSPPSTWIHLEILPLKYQIMYQWKNKGNPKSVKLGPFESTKVELKGLTPGRLYLFQVCAKELLGLGECSNWSSAVNITIPPTNPQTLTRLSHDQ